MFRNCCEGVKIRGELESCPKLLLSYQGWYLLILPSLGWSHERLTPLKLHQPKEESKMLILGLPSKPLYLKSPPLPLWLSPWAIPSSFPQAFQNLKGVRWQLKSMSECYCVVKISERCANGFRNGIGFWIFKCSQSAHRSDYPHPPN